MRTFHGTGVFVNDDLKISHSDSDTTAAPLYAERSEKGIVLFLLRNSKREYVASLEKNASITLSDEPTVLRQVHNADGSFSLILGKVVLSARKGKDSFSFVPAVKAWEHFFMVETNVIDIADDNIFAVRTAHHTELILNNARTLVHKVDSAVQPDDLKVFARATADEFNLFVIKNNAVKYIREIDDHGKTVLTDERTALSVVRNILDGSVSLTIGNGFLSARKGTEQFRPAPRNLAWEHLILDKINLWSLDKMNVAVVAADMDSIDTAVARLNDNNADVRSIMVDGVDDKGIAAAQNNATADCFYLLSGYDNRAEKFEYMSARLESRGVARKSIVDISLKMQPSPQWSANVKAALTTAFDFIVTGDIHTAVSFDLAKITRRNGINLSVDGQDLRQSYWLARHIFENRPANLKNSIKFVLIGLTPESLNIEDASRFGRDCRYIFAEGGSSFDEKIFYPIMKSDVKFPSEPSADPNLIGLKNSCGDDPSISCRFFMKNTPFVLHDSALEQLEEYIRLCLEHGAKPVAILPPATAEAYDADTMNLLRHTLRTLESGYDFELIDLSDLPLRLEEIDGKLRLNGKDVEKASDLLNFRLRSCDVLPMEDMRFVQHDRIFGIQPFMTAAEYDGMMDKILTAAFLENYGA